MIKKSLLIVGTFFSAILNAETMTQTIEIEADYPIALIENESFTMPIHLGAQFSSIEELCVQFEFGDIESFDGIADSLSVEREIERTEIKDKLLTFFPSYSILKWAEIINPIYDDQGNVLVPGSTNYYLSNVNACLPVSGKALRDGVFNLDLLTQGGGVEIKNVTVNVKGTESTIRVISTLDEHDNFYVPSYGGRVNYDLEIFNNDEDNPEKRFKSWSVIYFPDATPYPVKTPHNIAVKFNEPKLFNRNYLNIPAWFEPGEYDLYWFLQDPETQEQVQAHMRFVKE
ncbi:hypothetical protein [Marinibactrum halimedae]|uniref:Uncharacterized protein n=1 Tax=Marinibactrum halimedae TaxID=1444977 RepID=A0AA37WKG0_9GAMM|nr:hypothetical protein [Marinibactrum halimedae]MCD9457694.1 hypothetical protein [Marinibactrum halimedae]GLS24933.1 hypothetical protein GCM10007877_06470 [Marinibactrum halimedae]